MRQTLPFQEEASEVLVGGEALQHCDHVAEVVGIVDACKLDVLPAITQGGDWKVCVELYLRATAIHLLDKFPHWF